jgi:hypothetical protein
MTKLNLLSKAQQWHLRSVTKCLLLALLLTVSSGFAGATAVPVVLAPVPKPQYFDNSGRPLAFGCLFSYVSGTTTPLATYTDYTGTVQNTNPVILTIGGFTGTGSSGVWIQAGQAYSLKVVSAGGTNCALGTTQYTIDGIGGGLTILTTLVTYSATPVFPVQAENQLFEITLTGNAVAQPMTAVGIIPPAWIAFQITQDSAGGHTFTWPANLIGGAPIGTAANQVTSQFFYWNGTNAIALGPGVTGAGPAVSVGSLIASGTITGTQLISNIATGTPPLVVASTTQVANLNSSQLEGGTWEAPGAIGSTTPNTGKFTTVIVGGSAAQTSVQGSPDVKLLSSSTVTGTGSPLCTDANGGATTSCSGSGPVFAPQRVNLGSPVGLVANTQTIVLTESVSFPSGTGTYRADVRYSAWMTAGNNACAAEAIDTTNSRAFALSGLDGNGSGFSALTSSEVSSATYAAGATATFTLQIQCNAGQTVTVNSGLFTFTPAEASFLAVTPVLSN